MPKFSAIIVLCFSCVVGLSNLTPDCADAAPQGRFYRPGWQPNQQQYQQQFQQRYRQPQYRPQYQFQQRPQYRINNGLNNNGFNNNGLNHSTNLTLPNSATSGSGLPKKVLVGNKPVTPEEAMKLYNRPKTNPPPKIEPGSIYPRIAGEFEPQGAIVVSLCELFPQHGKVFKRIAELTHDHVKLVVLFNEPKQVSQAVELLGDSSVSMDHVFFMKLKMDTVWLRDFGPIMAEEKDGSMTIDFFYNGQRPVDDTFPKRWADMIETTHNSVPWTIQGGNLLCNGKGLALTTTRLFEDNQVHFPGQNSVQEGRDFVIDEFKKYTNLQHIEILEPLREEATRHADMFATFIAPDHVMVAKLDPYSDPVNARILDYNAQKLARLKVDGKPLKVDRVPIPPRRGTAWSSYTNVIVVNKLIMIPVVRTDDMKIMREAVDVYRKKLPDHRVATVDITSMAKLQGALHCMSINIPEFAPLPEKIVSFERNSEWIKTLDEKRQQVTSAKKKTTTNQ